MAGQSPVIEDGSALSIADRSLLVLERWLAVASGIAIFSLMILAVVSVGGRNAMNAPLPGYVDWIEQAMPLIAFLGIAFAQRDGAHIRMDVFIGRLRGRALWTAELVTTVLALGLMLALVWGSWAHFQRSFDFGSPLWSRDSSIDIGLPIWPAKLLAPAAFAILCLRLAIQVAAYARALALGQAAPAAVPLPQDAAAQAAAEASQLVGSARGATPEGTAPTRGDPASGESDSQGGAAAGHGAKDGTRGRSREEPGRADAGAGGGSGNGRG